MNDYLSAEALMRHIHALAVEIGPRPAGSAQEALARAYISQVLHEHGLGQPQELHFDTPDTWGYTGLAAALITLGGNLLGRSRFGRLVGGLATLSVVYGLWRMFSAQRTPLEAFAPHNPTATLVVRIPPKGDVRRKLVLLGHTDTNKHRLSFRPELKHNLLPAFSFVLGVGAINGAAQVLEALGLKFVEPLRRLSFLGILGGLGFTLADETGGFVDGANDNATAVACLLGLGAHLKAHPLEHTEVWLAFTGAEEVGCLGAHALLDAYGAELKDAWFIDFEMVGAGDICYITEHSGLSYLNTYKPDDESEAWALETARAHAEMGVRGAPMTILEEVGALRGRGYRGICLAGVGDDGWLVNWHQSSDNTAHIQPACVEKAARFAWAMIQRLDQK
jgi:hypothetical protein